MHAVASVRQQPDAMVRLPHAVITALQALATLVVHLVLGGFTPSAQVTYAIQVVQIVEVEAHASVVVQHAHTDAPAVVHLLIAPAALEITARVDHALPDIVALVAIAMELELVLVKLVQQDMAVLVGAIAIMLEAVLHN